jgi:RNA polymerase sigma factor (sigma-70 family)
VTLEGRDEMPTGRYDADGGTARLVRRCDAAARLYYGGGRSTTTAVQLDRAPRPVENKRMLSDAPANLIRRLRGGTPLESLSDEELIARAKRGDSEAFGQLYRRHVGHVYLYVKTRVNDRKLAEDLTQDVFVNAYRAVGRFHWQGQIRPWLRQIAHHRIANHWRAVGRRPQEAELPEGDAEADASSMNSTSVDPLEHAERALASADLTAAMSHLTDLERQVIALRFGLELSLRETAEEMGRSEASVRSLQYRAVQRFRSCMTHEDDTR